jgi:hypothetical protein
LSPQAYNRPMTTPFYDHHFKRPFPFTLLMLERIGELHEQGEPDLSRTVAELVDPPPDDMAEAAEYVSMRLMAPPKDAPADASPSSRRKTLGEALSSMLKGLALVDELVLAFGLAEARRLYCEEDRDDVLLALSLWHRQLSGRHTMAFEAALYGFGGSYKGDGGSAAPAEIIDMSDPGKGFASLKAFAEQANGVLH